MKNALKIVPALVAFAACGGVQAGAQPQAPEGADRLHLYEVAPDVAAQVASTGFIEVSGTGMVSVEADRAHLSFAVETRRATAGDAAAQNADLMTRVLEAVRGSGVASLNVETFGYSLRPDYTRADGNMPPVIMAYVAANNIRVTFADISEVGRVLDTAIEAGANRVSGLSFSASNTAQAERDALTEAVGDARMQALTIAVALGHELGDALEVFHGSRPSAGPQYEMAQMRASTPIEPSEQTVRATVTIRFALGPERSQR